LQRGQDSVAQRFMDDLRRLRQLAGRPSYSTLEKLSAHRLRRATMSDVLNGNRVNLPDWRFVHEFVSACRAAARESGLDANELGTVADWKRHWDGAAGGVIDARFPGHGSQPAGGQEQAVAPRQTAPEPTESNDQPPADQGGTGVRPSVWGPVPSRLPDFVGRESWLETLRQTLTRDGLVGVVAVQGLLGVGKTQLAIEYASRHARDYDLVWWIPCEDMEAAHAAMADLAARIGIAPAEGADTRDYGELFDVLRRRQRFARWLLIFDNVDEPEDIRSLMPPLPGDILVTTRSNRWEASADLLELDVFEREESMQFLRRRMREFTAESAHLLAKGVGDLPLLLEHAVESRVTVDAYLARLAAEPLSLLDDQPADYHATIASVWRMVVDQLRANAPDALDLLCCLAFFGTDPIPRESLERGSHVTDVSIHAMLCDPIRLAGAIARLRRAGLLRMPAPTRNLAMHRVTQGVVRDLIAKSGAAGEIRVRHDVHLLLAAADPLAPENPDTWSSYEQLRGHMAASGIATCRQESTRKFVVNMVRFLNAAGLPMAALDMADGALAHWDAEAADDRPSAADCRMAMRTAKADALFAQGRRSEAFQLRQEALDAMRSDPGRWTAEIISLGSTSGARLRIAGKFEEALAADRESVHAHVAEFGDDDPRTLTAVSNLVTDLALSGRGAEASAYADRAYRDCLAFYNAAHPSALVARNVLGRCRWLCGDYGEAVGILAEVHRGYDQLAGQGVLGEDHPWRLCHEIDYAIARRDKGLMTADRQALADDMHQVRRRCWRALGANHPQTLAATVVLASILRRIDGRAGEAARLLEDAKRRYHSALPNHPYGHACNASLSVVRYRAATGDIQQAAAQSVPVIRNMLHQLADSVGDAHPLSLSALSSLANALACAGEPDMAVKYGQEAVAGFQVLLGPGHPHTRAAEANTEIIQSGLVEAPASLAPTGLVETDFTPLPL
jgi:tetratricopeptide (TPR) repeat protein